jgi:hypothetical protein
MERGEFSLRRFFSAINFDRVKNDGDALALEEDFQALLGSELNHVCGHRYTVTLEPMLPEATRRDVLCQAGSSRATIELKMSARWSLKDYLEALEMQLYGQYMRAKNSRIGFFVIVLQRARAWPLPEGGSIDFSALQARLVKRAQEIEARDSEVFLRVVGIDATPRPNFRAAQGAGAKRPALSKLQHRTGAGQRPAPRR